MNDRTTKTTKTTDEHWVAADRISGLLARSGYDVGLFAAYILQEEAPGKLPQEAILEGEDRVDRATS